MIFHTGDARGIPHWLYLAAQICENTKVGLTATPCLSEHQSELVSMEVFLINENAHLSYDALPSRCLALGGIILSLSLMVQTSSSAHDSSLPQIVRSFPSTLSGAHDATMSSIMSPSRSLANIVVAASSLSVRSRLTKSCKVSRLLCRTSISCLR